MAIFVEHNLNVYLWKKKSHRRKDNITQRGSDVDSSSSENDQVVGFCQRVYEA
jgi:hypothetical protein